MYLNKTKFETRNVKGNVDTSVKLNDRILDWTCSDKIKGWIIFMSDHLYLRILYMNMEQSEKTIYVENVKLYGIKE